MFVVGTFNADLDKSSSKNLRSARSRMRKSGATRSGGMAGRHGNGDGEGHLWAMAERYGEETREKKFNLKSMHA